MVLRDRFLMRPQLNGVALGEPPERAEDQNHVSESDGASRFLNRLERACEAWGEVNPQEFAQLVRDIQRVTPERQFDVLAQAFASDHYLKQEYVNVARRSNGIPTPPAT